MAADGLKADPPARDHVLLRRQEPSIGTLATGPAQEHGAVRGVDRPIAAPIAPALPPERWWLVPLNAFRVVFGRAPRFGGGAPMGGSRATGSLSRRMIGVAALWILLLLGVGGFALDRVLVSAVTRNFDDQLAYVLSAMIASAEIDPLGDVRFNRPLGDQRFLEPNSSLYWQVSAPGREPFPSRSLWDRRLRVPALPGTAARYYDSGEFPDERLRIVERNLRLPGSPATWRFQVAQGRSGLDEQIGVLRHTLIRSFALLGIGLLVMASLQATFGLWPLRKVRRALGLVKTGAARRVDDRLPIEVAPLVEELNDLLAHIEKQGEEARAHAGNLAHALKTPLTVIMNEATAHSPDLEATVVREATTMRRQVDHHLARARAVGRRGAAQSYAEVWPSLKAVERAVSRLHRRVTVDLAGDKAAAVHVERQDLDEMVGNLIENAAKYGGGRVFVTVERHAGERGTGVVEIMVEDDGPGIPAAERASLFQRGARLDTGKPGTGLGLAIVRDVAEIYGGRIDLDESEDLGGLMARLRLPAAAAGAGPA